MSYIKRAAMGNYEAASNEPYFPFSPNPPASDDCGCGGSCGGCGGHDHGMGLFDSMDPTTWGTGELIVAGVGGYLAVKLVGDLGKGGKRVKRAVRRSPRAAAGGLGFVGMIALAGGAYYLWTKSQASTGLGAYMPQSYVNPQRLLDPVGSAAIQLPRGW